LVDQVNTLDETEISRSHRRHAPHEPLAKVQFVVLAVADRVEKNAAIHWSSSFSDR